MLKFIIRLDDACPTMNEEKWIKVEKILDKYNIKPIVGIIPDNMDTEFDYPIIKDFWTKYATKWQDKNWIIALHGLHHSLTKDIRTEFKNKSYEEQVEMINKGCKILKENGISPVCFFAPNHTFDNNTIRAIKNNSEIRFISDGYAFFPYIQEGVTFIPSAFDTPHKISKRGVFTFVCHPNNTNESDLEYLEDFIKKYKDNFNINIDEIINKYSERKKSLKDYTLQVLIYMFRKVRAIHE